ncbi:MULTISPECIES: tyrosine-type recombinase/integrase [Marinomonas]|uniref:Tyrosine-type recombinase/integrase n=1 Tax=Marinomonas rhodophyticola TaxID=2992803 RepID=A0ABT3KGC0_9GAMM|nr:tyrosine-type recombinase/integrase [Marinomonas sp. KJ51-3]MCW4629586.1 tyrosine-type recombinase/integrase [Marinomonas sp. KJ51-3]
MLSFLKFCTETAPHIAPENIQWRLFLKLRSGEFEQPMIATQYNIDVPPESKSERIGAAIVFAIETAMRAGEICGITWEDVNLERRTVYLPKTNNGNPRTVPLSTAAVKVLEKLKTLVDCKLKAFNLKLGIP